MNNFEKIYKLNEAYKSKMPLEEYLQIVFNPIVKKLQEDYGCMLEYRISRTDTGEIVSEY